MMGNTVVETDFDMSNPFSTIITGDSVLDRIQANITSAFNASLLNQVINININTFTVPSSGCFLMIDTTQIPGVSSSVPQKVLLPDAVKNPGFFFHFNKTDTTSNIILFVTTSKNRRGEQQKIQGSDSPYSVSDSLALGGFFSDGENWWALSS